MYVHVATAVVTTHNDNLQLNPPVDLDGSERTRSGRDVEVASFTGRQTVAQEHKVSGKFKNTNGWNYFSPQYALHERRSTHAATPCLKALDSNHCWPKHRVFFFSLCLRDDVK